MNTLSILNLMPSTKSEVSKFIGLLTNEILGSDPLNAAIQISALEKIVKTLRADPEIREMIVEELEKYNGKVVFQGNEIERAETGTKYDFQGDHVLQDLDQQMLSIKNSIKERQSILKALKKSAYDEDGIEMKPAIKSSTTNYKITLK